jgi:transposase
VIDLQTLHTLEAPQLRQAVHELSTKLLAQERELEQRQRELVHKQALLDKLVFENATLKRLKYAARSEAYSAEQKSLLEETFDADLAAVAVEIEALRPKTDKPAGDKGQAKRLLLPPELPRREIRHEPESTTCDCGESLKRIGEDVAEKLDYVPGVFSVERHIRGTWVCRCCEKVIQAPVPAHVIDKGIPTTGLLAQVLVAKYLDHLPLYRQEAIFGRAGHVIARSTLAAWVGECGVQLQPLVDALAREMLEHKVLHADETPVAMLSPGKGKTHRSYVWTYCTTPFAKLKAVVFDFATSRGGQHVRAFLGLEQPGQAWKGKLVVDDFSGYKACFELGVTEIGCMAHARRKFHELWANHQSPVGQQALEYFIQLYDIEREVADLDAERRREIRQARSRPLMDALYAWLVQQRQKLPEGSATIKAVDYSLKRWDALTKFIDDGDLPIDNNWVENQIRPIALGRSNWLFVGSERAGKRAAAVMSLLHSARINGHDPYAYLRNVLERLPTQPNSRIGELLPHRWQPSTIASAAS